MGKEEVNKGGGIIGGQVSGVRGQRGKSKIKMQRYRAKNEDRLRLPRRQRCCLLAMTRG